MDRVRAIGVELEGGFLIARYKKFRNEEDCFHGDSSVTTTQECNGEAVSPPYDDIDRLAKWITDHYPDEVNQTCGGHIHISLKSNLDYSRLMSKTFYKYFLKRWEMWGKKMDIKNPFFWERLQGKNARYCKREFEDPDLQTANQGDRYRHLNYCFKKHGTLENRMLPMFKEPEIYIAAVKFWVEVVERWLSLQKKENPITDVIQYKGLDIETVPMDVLEVDEPPDFLKETICV